MNAQFNTRIWSRFLGVTALLFCEGFGLVAAEARWKDSEVYVAVGSGQGQRPAMQTPTKVILKAVIDDAGDEIHYTLWARQLKNPVFIHLHSLALDAPIGVPNAPLWLDPETGPHVVTLFANAPDGIDGYGKAKEGQFSGKFLSGVITRRGTEFEEFEHLHGSAAGYSFDDLVEDLRNGDVYLNMHTDADSYEPFPDDGLPVPPSRRTNTGHGDVFFPGEIRGPVFGLPNQFSPSRHSSNE